MLETERERERERVRERERERESERERERETYQTDQTKSLKNNRRNKDFFGGHKKVRKASSASNLIGSKTLQQFRTKDEST